MTLAAAELLVNAAGLYAAAGVIFAALFLWRWVGRLDPAAQHASLGFRVLVLPGVVLFWPLFLTRLVRGATAPPDEWTAHRAAGRRKARTRDEVLR
jgi:hypothetical protein